MISSAISSALVLALEPAAAVQGCLPPKPVPGPGVADPFRAPDPQATELNAAAKVLYRQGRWDEARTEYRAAVAADPTFLAPRLNIACSFVRQERFAEAHDLIIRAWTQPGPFAYEGKHYHFNYVNPWPRPYQSPHPPIWVPSQGSASTIRWAAQMRYT